MSKLVQESMFGLPNVIVVDFTPKAEVESKPFDMDAWHKSIGGEWEQVQAAKDAARKAGGEVKDDGRAELAECRNHKATVIRNIRAAKRAGDVERAKLLGLLFRWLIAIKLPRLCQR